MAKAVGISASSVQRIWRDPHASFSHTRWRSASKPPMIRGSSKSCAMSSASACRAAGPCRDPVGRREEPDQVPRSHPAGFADEARAGVKAYPRLQASLARRHCSPPSTSSTALNIGRNMQRHRHRSSSASSTPSTPRPSKAIHAIVDNYATHNHPKVRKWLARHRRWTFHFTHANLGIKALGPPSEGFFAKLARGRRQTWRLHIRRRS